jgi:hypothetical protein
MGLVPDKPPGAKHSIRSWFSQFHSKNLLFDGKSIRKEKSVVKEKNAKNLMSLFESQMLWVWVGISGWFAISLITVCTSVFFQKLNLNDFRKNYLKLREKMPSSPN